MADITVTAANVNRITGNLKRGVAAEAITAGQSVYINASGLVALADADAVLTAAAVGIAECNAAAGQNVNYLTGGTMDVGATLTVGTTYVVSTTAGGIAPIADLASGDFTTILGIASAAGVLNLNIWASGIAKA